MYDKANLFFPKVRNLMTVPLDAQLLMKHGYLFPRPVCSHRKQYSSLLVRGAVIAIRMKEVSKVARSVSFPFDSSDGNDVRFQLPVHVAFLPEFLPLSLCRPL